GWEVATGEALFALGGHHRDVWAVAVEPDARTVLSADDEGHLRLWDVARGTQLSNVLVDPNGVTSLALDRASDTLATGGADGTLRIWSARTVLARGGETP